MVYVFLAQGFEEIEALTVVDILRRAGKEVVTVGIGDNIIRGSHGIVAVSDIEDFQLEFGDKLEMIVLPGGMPGTLNLEKSAAVKASVDYCVKKDIYIAAICAAPTILGHKNLLENKRACCYPGHEQELFGAEVVNDAVVIDGRIITSRGAGTAMSFALTLAEILSGKDKRRKLEDAIVCM